MNKRYWLCIIACLAIAQAAHAQQHPADMTKGIIELPTAKLLKGTDVFRTGSAQLGAAIPGMPAEVQWHAGLEDAQRAAKKSGKPVLLFQLLGQMDPGLGFA